MSHPAPKQTPGPEWPELVEKQNASIHFGSVQLIVHDSKVVPSETTEQVRLDKPSGKRGSSF